MELERTQIRATQVESEEGEASNQHPKRSKNRQPAQFPSNSMQDPNLTIPILPAEIITEILSRLPVKPLLQFRSVSKSWLALTSDPKFIKTHLNLSANKENNEDIHHMLILGLSEAKWNFKDCSLKSLLCDSVTEALDLDCPVKKSSECISIVGSCNGLIFLAHFSEYSFLWNPTIRKHKKLPDFRPRLKKNNSAIYGFGYDEFHDDYKVVGIFYNCESSNDVECKLYSLKSDSWTSVDYYGEILNAQNMKLNASGLFVNGKLHWDTISPGPYVCTGRNIVSFDLANEKWEMMEKPSYGVGENELCVGTLRNKLSVFSDYKGTHLGVWVMKEHGVKESWMKMFTINYPNDQNLYPPFFMSNKGEILAAYRSNFMIYNSKDHSFRYSDVLNFDGCFDAGIYFESLVCPFSTEERDNATKERQRKLTSKQSRNN